MKPKGDSNGASQISRRSWLGGTAAGLMTLLARGLPLGVGATVVGWPRDAYASVVLNTADISNFTLLGHQFPTTGWSSVKFSDASPSDLSGLYAPDPDAGPGTEIDLVVRFQMRSLTPANADGAFRVIINDGQTRSAVAACVILNGKRGIGLAGPGAPSDASTYPTFFAVDYIQAPVTLRLRRMADGGVELLEVNGVAPNPRVMLPPEQTAGRTRAGATAEFGCMSVEGSADVDVDVFYTETAAAPVAGALTFTRFRIRDTDSDDTLAFRADYSLGTQSNGLDPLTQPVTITLSTIAGVFYQQFLHGFSLKGVAPRRRWTLNDAERVRTGIDQLVIDESANNTGGIFLRDVSTQFADIWFGTVTAEVTIGGGGAGMLLGTAQLVEKVPGSGNWRFSREP